MPQKRIPTIVRYLTKLDQSAGADGCWPWTGAKDWDGYGIFWNGEYYPNITPRRGVYVRAHRWGYQHFVGPVPEGLNLCHTCDNPRCCNPSHLFPGTHADNHADREAKGRGGQWMTRGERHVNHKLTEDAVRDIRARFGKVSALTLAAQYNVSDALIGKVVRRQIWQHVE